MKQVEEAIEIYYAGVESVLPANLVSKSVSFYGTQLTCQSVSLDLRNFKHIYLLGFGKASAAMAASMEELLGDSVTGGHVLCLLYTSPSPRDRQKSRMPSSA